MDGRSSPLHQTALFWGDEMIRKDLDYIVIVLLAVSGLYATLSGLLADVFGLNDVVLHAEAGYACAMLAVGHLALNRRQLGAYVRRRFRPLARRQQPSRATERTGARTAPVLARRQVITSGITATVGFFAGWLVSGRSQGGLPEGVDDVGQFYHNWSKPGYNQVLGRILHWGERPPLYKSYPGATRIGLPEPGAPWGGDVAEVLDTRRSRRDYTGEPLPIEALSRLLHAAQGITNTRGKRAAPSAGAMYPIEVYAMVHNVAGLDAGIYHYAVETHELELTQAGDFRGAIQRAALGQEFLAEANVCLVLSAIFQRARWRYRERTYRYVTLEAGHIGQNLYLAATALGLGACAVGAFIDDELNELLAVDGQEEAGLYIISVGTL
jgi:SagB-type dehydrogenase family enzyme